MTREPRRVRSASGAADGNGGRNKVRHSVSAEWTPVFAGGTKRLEVSLAPEQLLLLVDIFLRHVAGRDERLDASLGHVTGILLEAHVE